MTSFLLAAVCAGLCAPNVFLGFMNPPRFFRHYAQSGAIVFFLLTFLTAYFGSREIHAVDELAALIQPIPEIVGVMYVPTPEEMQAIANSIAAIPGTTRTGNTQAERQRLAKDVESFRTRYWRLDTNISSESVMNFYRDEMHRRDWVVDVDSEPFLTLQRGAESLIIYTEQNRLRSITEVWYLYNKGSD